jgi:quercetin dioxygenase-like cupin family protein
VSKGWVLAGAGREEGTEIVEVFARRSWLVSDVISCPPGEKHWHGAIATTGMSHIAIQEQLDGKAVDWLEKVSDEQYLVESKAE